MIPLSTIKIMLRDEDVEGYIRVHGAPDNEYDSEAEEIFNLLDNVTAYPDENEIMAAIVYVWERYFNLDADDMKKRQPYLLKVARNLAQLV